MGGRGWLRARLDGLGKLFPVPVEPYPEHQRGDAWEGNGHRSAEPQPDPPPGAYQFTVVDAGQFTAQRPDWLAKGCLVRGQPAVIGGPLKCLKTSVSLDLAISLATATPFLGQFPVYQPRRVVVLSGESGEYAIESVVDRVCAGRGLDRRTALAGRLKLGFCLPKFGDLSALLELKRGLVEVGAEVAIVDPLYLTLLTGGDVDPANAANLYATGPLLLGAAEVCLSAGVTPVIAHHFRRSIPAPPAKPELHWLSHSGVAEFARQWLLLSRREEYDGESGLHRLWLSYGGSVGHSGLLAVDVDEGRLGEDFSGRTWVVTTATAAAEETLSKARGDAKRVKDYGSRLLAALDCLDPHREGVSFRQLRLKAALNSESAERGLLQLVEEGVVEELEVASGRQRAVRGVRRTRPTG